MRSQAKRIRSTYDEYPREFWVLMGASFIDALGSALLYPFFALYVTRTFEVGLSQVGLIFAALTISTMIGTTIGGGLTDRFGRKPMVIFGLVASALTILVLGFVKTIEGFIPLVVIVGLLGNIGGPARTAMVADLLPAEKRAGGFGMHRVVFNLAYVIGPALGGLLAATSYLYLFIFDTISSLLAALVFATLLRETKPLPQEGAIEESTVQTFAGYGKVLADRFYLFFLIATLLLALVFSQFHGPLSVFLRDMHGLSEQYFGGLLSVNATMVVLFQFSITRRTEKYPPFLILSAGTLMLAVGFGMYGFVTAGGLFLLAIVIVTLGEMFVAPVGQALAAKLAPEHMRGRYMAFYDFAWMIPGALGMYMAGLIMDNYDPRWIWHATALVGIIAAAAFIGMHILRREVPETLPELEAAP